MNFNRYSNANKNLQKYCLMVGLTFILKYLVHGSLFLCIIGGDTTLVEYSVSLSKLFHYQLDFVQRKLLFGLTVVPNIIEE